MPKAKTEYLVLPDGDKFFVIASDLETVGVFNSEGEARAEIAREQRDDAIWDRTTALIRSAVRSIMSEFSVDLPAALRWVNSAEGITELGMEEEEDSKGVIDDL